MKIKLRNKLGKEKEEVEPLVLPDKYQFDLSKLDVAEEVINEIDNQLTDLNVETFAKTQPYANFVWVESYVRKLKQENYTGRFTGITLVEYDFPAFGERTKKNKQPKKEIVESLNLEVNITSNTVHLPQIIADYLMNFKSAEAGYEARVQYITDILEIYSKLYGSLFADKFGLLPPDAIDLPAEMKWKTMYDQNEHVNIAGLYNAEKIKGRQQKKIEKPMPTPTKNTEVVTIQTSSTHPDGQEAPRADGSHDKVDDNNTKKMAGDERTHESVPNVPHAVENTNTSKQAGTIRGEPTNLLKANQLQKRTRTQENNHTFELEETFNHLDDYRSAGNVAEETRTFQVLDGVTSADDLFVENQLNKRKNQQAEEIQKAVKTLNDSAASKMGDLIDQQQSSVDTLIARLNKESDLPQEARQIVTPVVQQEKQTAHDQIVQKIDQQKSKQIELENQRHSDALTQIETDAEQELSSQITANDEKYQKEQQERYDTTLAELTETFEKTKADKVATALKLATSTLTTKADTLKNKSREYLLALEKTHQESLNEYEAEQQKIHLKAKELKVQDDQTHRSDELIEKLNNKINQQDKMLLDALDMQDSQEARIAQLNSENAGLKKVLTDKDKTSEESSNDSTPQQNSVAEAVAMYAAMQGVNNQTANATKDSDANPKRGMSVGAAILTGFLTCSVILGAGLAVFTGHQKYTEVTASNTALEKKMSRMASESAKESSEAKRASSEKVDASNKSSKTNGGQPEADTIYSDLDRAIANGDTSVYTAKYKGKDLGSDKRVLEVGQKLVQNGDNEAALQVVKDNPQHNQLLKAYLGV